jgi:hypothetical protein
MINEDHRGVFWGQQAVNRHERFSLLIASDQGCDSMDLQIGNHLSCHAVCCVSEDKEFESFILLLLKSGFTGYI